MLRKLFCRLDLLLVWVMECECVGGMRCGMDRDQNGVKGKEFRLSGVGKYSYSAAFFTLLDGVWMGCLRVGGEVMMVMKYNTESR